MITENLWIFILNSGGYVQTYPKQNVSVFYTNNLLAHAQLEVFVNDKLLPFNITKYLGVTLNRVLSYNNHFQNCHQNWKAKTILYNN